MFRHTSETSGLEARAKPKAPALLVGGLTVLSKDPGIVDANRKLRNIEAQLDARTYLIDGTMNVRELNRTQNWELPTDGPKTINGLVLELLETIPEPGTCLKIKGYPCEIIAADDNRIRSVRIGPRDVLEADSD